MDMSISPIQPVKFICCAILIIFITGARGFGAELILASSNKTDYQIVIPKVNASDSIGDGLKQTAKLMQAAFQANGFNIAISLEGTHDASKPAIYLGDTSYAKDKKVDISKLNGWGYIHKVVDNNLIIAGRDESAPAKSIEPRRPYWDRFGTTKGVVDFLQKYVGTRFLYPDLGPAQPISASARIDLLKSPAIEYLKISSITIPINLDIIKTPSIEFNTAHPARGSFYDIAHNRFPMVDTLFGGHTYERAVPREKYGETHLEYFALINGQRTANAPGNAQYCISNPDVQKLIYEDMINSINMGFKAVDIGQPDGFRACQCEKCEKLYNTGKDWGEKLWLFHRSIAEKVEIEKPGNRVTIMSYIQTENPPKSFKSFPKNTRILLTGTNEEDIAPWLNHEVPAGFSSYIYNWCPNLGTRYTPMRTPLFVETQVRRLVRNRIASVYRDGPGDLYGLEGPVYYTMGKMFDDPINLNANLLMKEFCSASFGKASQPMIQFYDQLYHAIELYSDYLGTRAPAWVYHNIYGQRRKHLTDPFQLMGFLYTPSLLASMENQLSIAEKTADSDKAKTRLAVVRKEFDYLKAFAQVVHLTHAFQIRPDINSRNRLLDSIDERNALIDSFFTTNGKNPKNTGEWAYVMFPPVGHDAKHLKLAYDGYQEPYANSPMNWDTKAMRNAALPGAKKLFIGSAKTTSSIALDSQDWNLTEKHSLNLIQNQAESKNKSSFKILADQANLYVLIENQLPQELLKARIEDLAKQDTINLLFEPKTGDDIIYRFTVNPNQKSKQDAAKGFVKDPLDPRFGRFDPDWNGNWTYSTKLDFNNSKWVGFLTIPFKTLGIENLGQASLWRGNISRIRTEHKDQLEISQWSFNSSTKILDDPNDFGEFHFKESKEK